MRISTCPKPAALATIAALACAENFGQTQKLAFRRRGNAVISAADIILLATWTNFKAAAGDTKVIVTPYVENPTMEPGKIKEHGSGNEVRNGIPINTGTSPTKFSFNLNQYTEASVVNIRALMDEDLEVFLISEHGKIGCIKSGSDYTGIPIQQLFVSDRVLGGLEAVDYYELSFQMAGYWSEDWAIVDPTANFSALNL